MRTIIHADYKNVQKHPGPEPLCPDCLQRLLRELRNTRAVPEFFRENSPVILCIGTDRMIGDSLGPFVGTLLGKAAGRKLSIYGSLASTVHALNLPEVNAQIKKRHPNRTVIAVDASFGAQEHIGSVFVRPGSLQPGAGVRKNLPPAGDITITGIVGAWSSHPYLDLQTVRLSMISSMAEQICQCILEVCV